MATLLGILIGIVVTIFVGRYYFRRTTQKRLTPYFTLSTGVFSGIDPSVRKKLKFSFKDNEVTDLHQIEFLIANDGERAISQCIEPLSLELPEDVKSLDTSILFTKPEDLKVEVSEKKVEGKARISFEFPLLNKGDFFLVKLLLSGSISPKDLIFHIMCDDLPRSLKARWLPSEATKEKKIKVDWFPFCLGVFLLILVAAIIYAVDILLDPLTPNPLTYYWTFFSATFYKAALITFCTIGLVLMFGLGFAVIFGIGLEDLVSRGPRFPLPAELSSRSFFPLNLEDFIEKPNESEKTSSKKKEE